MTKVTSIGSEAFRECTSLKEITIPKTVEAMDKFVFWGCRNLTVTFEGAMPADFFRNQIFKDAKDITVKYPASASWEIDQDAYGYEDVKFVAY